MPTPFDALDSLLTATVHSVFAEAFRIVAYKIPAGDVDALPIPDPDKLPLDVMAEFVAQAKSTPLPARGAMQDDNAHSVTASHPQIHVDDVMLLWPPVRGCRVIRLATGETWQISRPPRPDGFGHTCIDLTNKLRVTP